MIDLTAFNCTGCTACYSICPYKAIEMVADQEGFKFPRIDAVKCTNCGLCEKVCVASSGYIKPEFTVKAYGVKNKNLEERKQSQSGGAFYVLAKYILSKGGVVYGAQIDEGFVVRHARGETEEQVKKFRGSKYVQSDLGDIFSTVKNDLQLGVPVLFSGTPCQVAGLKAFLRKDYENLLLVDLICHGVPSPKVWADYVEWQQNRKPKKVFSQANFRDKSYRWGSHYESFLIGNKKKRFDIYTRIFYSHNAHRKACYKCPFTNVERLSDVTIADYWGIENVNPRFRDYYGVSVLLVNSKNGQVVWNETCNQCDHFECSVDNIIPRNPHLVKPVKQPVTRAGFWVDYAKGFGFIAKKYGGNNLKENFKRLIRRILRRM